MADYRCTARARILRPRGVRPPKGLEAARNCGVRQIEQAPLIVARRSTPWSTTTAGVPVAARRPRPDERGSPKVVRVDLLQQEPGPGAEKPRRRAVDRRVRRDGPSAGKDAAGQRPELGGDAQLLVLPDLQGAGPAGRGSIGNFLSSADRRRSTMPANWARVCPAALAVMQH